MTKPRSTTGPGGNGGGKSDTSSGKRRAPEQGQGSAADRQQTAPPDQPVARVIGYLMRRDPASITDAELVAMRDAEARGEPRVSPFDLALGDVTAADVDRMRALPRRTLPVIVDLLPAWLDGMADTDPVRVFAHGFDSLTSAGVVRLTLTHAHARQSSGRLRAGEVAHLLADAGQCSAEEVSAEISAGFARGRLDFYSAGATLEPVDVEAERRQGEPLYGSDWAAHTLGYADRVTTPEAVDRWLDAIDPSRRRPRIPSGPWSGSAEAAPAKSGRRADARGRNRSPQQDDAVIAAIRSMKLDPLRLPSTKGTNKPGVKAEVIKLTGLTKGQVGHAWKRLRRDRRVREVNE